MVPGKLDSVSSMNIFPKKGLPKGHFASAATRDFHDNCEQKFFLEARAIKSQFLPVRAQDIPNNLNKERIAILTLKSFMFKKPNKALLANRQPSFLQLFA